METKNSKRCDLKSLRCYQPDVSLTEVQRTPNYHPQIATKYDVAKIPLENGSDLRPPVEVQKSIVLSVALTLFEGPPGVSDENRHPWDCNIEVTRVTLRFLIVTHLIRRNHCNATVVLINSEKLLQCNCICSNPQSPCYCESQI